MIRRWLLALLTCLLLPSLAHAQTYTITPSPFQTAFDNSGKIINGSCIWTYVAGTTTAATTYTTSSGVANSNPIIADSAGRFTAYLAPGSSYKFVYESACTPPSHGTTLRTADNISAMPAASGVVDVTGTAGESITLGQCVYLSAGDGGKTAGQWYKCDSGNAYSATTNWLGLATVNIATSASGTIRLAGQLTGLSSLSPGSTYYVGTAGALATSAPTNARRVGEADSATSLVLGSPTSPLVGSVPTNGQIPIGNGTNYLPATLTAGANIAVTNAAGTVTVAAMPLATRVTADVSATSSTLANLSDLTVTVAAGAHYAFRAQIVMTPDNTGGWKLSPNGTATMTDFTSELLEFKNGTGITVSGIVSYAGNLANTGSTNSVVTIDGAFTVNAGGTFTIQFAQSTASGTSKVLKNSSLIVTQTTN